jgi:hypothetical protein
MEGGSLRILRLSGSAFAFSPSSREMYFSSTIRVST